MAGFGCLEGGNCFDPSHFPRPPQLAVAQSEKHLFSLPLSFSSFQIMSTIENGAAPVVLPQPQPAAVDVISESLSNLALQSLDLPKEPPLRPQNDPTPRPLIMYSRSQLLFLHKSPLVKIPNGMPAFKDWFGYAAPYPQQCNAHRRFQGPKATRATPRKIPRFPHLPAMLVIGGGCTVSHNRVLLLTCPLRFRRDAEDGGMCYPEL